MTNIYVIDILNRGGGDSISLKIVGTVTNLDEVKDIENICKVFVVENWIDNIDYPVIRRKHIKKPLKSSKKSIRIVPHNYHRFPRLMVRGFK
jgi:hypothetical protein